MNNELSNAIETISTCAESVSELSTALDKYLSSFERIQKTVSDIQKHEESTADILDTVSLQISEQIEKTQNWAEEVVPEAVRTLTDLSARTVELTEGTGKELEKSLSILTSAVDELGPIVKEMDGISAALHSVSEKTAELPQLSKVSKEIHNSLGILSGLDELEVISEKLDSKIAAIELEKKELVEPLKNAAKFTEIVKAENVEIHEKIDAVGLTLARENESMQELLATFSMKEPDSFAAKMDYLVTAMVELSSKIDAATAQKQGGLKGLFGSSSRDSGNDESVNTAEKRSIAEHLKRNFCVVVKPNWYNDYVFVPESLEAGTVNGQVYVQGKRQGTKSFPADTEEFLLYRGKYLDDVLEQELIRRQDRNTHE